MRYFSLSLFALAACAYSQSSCQFCDDCNVICAVYSGIDEDCLRNCLNYYCPSNPVCYASSASAAEVDFSPVIRSNEFLSYALVSSVLVLSFFFGFAAGSR